MFGCDYISTATIKDVATKAGVSIATVSRVINGADNVNEALRAAVLQAVAELEFIPNSAARSMKMRSSHTIGIVVSDFSLPFFARVTKQIERDCRKDGSLVLFANTYDDPALEKHSVDFMAQKQVDVIVVLSTGENEEYISRLRQRGISIIFIDRRPKNSDFPSIYVDKRKGMYDVVKFLSEQNHRDIAFISGPRQLITNEDRYLGAVDCAKDLGFNENNIHYFFNEFSAEYAISIMEELFCGDSNWQPSAVIAGSAAIASGVFLFCKEHNFSIPDDLSLISFEDFAVGQLIEPRLSFVDGAYEEIGNELIKMIHAALDKTLVTENYPIEAHLVINDSVKARKSKS